MPDAKPQKARIEVFRPGTFTPMGGKPIAFSAADLRAAAAAYDPSVAPAPIVVGHPTVDAPAFGWADAFDYDPGTERMGAHISDIAPEFAEAVKAGRYRKVSMAFHAPTASNNPVPGVWYPKHIGFLGGAAPAVAGLKNASFSENQEGVVEFAMTLPGQTDLPALFAALAEMLTGRGADAMTPKIEWLDGAPAFSAPEAKTAPAPENPATDAKEKEPPVDKTKEEAAFAAKEAALAEREQALAAREALARSADHAAFAEALVEAGKLIPASKNALIAILNELGGDQASVAFAEGSDKLTPAAALRKLLNDQPKVIEFAQVKTGEDNIQEVAFAADGKPVDSSRLELMRKAEAYQREHPDVEFMDAIKAVQ